MIRVKDDDVNDDDGSSSFRLLKRIIDRKTQKPWKDAERRKLNHRYLARENLLEAKEEWATAEKSYKKEKENEQSATRGCQNQETRPDRVSDDDAYTYVRAAHIVCLDVTHPKSPSISLCYVHK